MPGWQMELSLFLFELTCSRSDSDGDEMAKGVSGVGCPRLLT